VEGSVEGLVEGLCSSHIMCTKDRFCRYMYRELGIWVMYCSNNHRVYMLAEGSAEGSVEGLVEGLCSSHIMCTKDRFCRYMYRELGIWVMYCSNNHKVYILPWRQGS
jgi:rRNA-processing protein FCF1